jgi:hypothetical protein
MSRLIDELLHSVYPDAIRDAHVEKAARPAKPAGTGAEGGGMNSVCEALAHGVARHAG